MKVFDEPLLNSRIEVAQSPLLDGPPLMFKPCPSPPIQRSQRRYVWHWLLELTTKMAQDRGRHISNDLNVVPVMPTRPSCKAAPIQRRDRNALRMARRSRSLSVNQQEIRWRLRKIMPADIRRLQYAHREPRQGELQGISPRPSWSNENVIHRKPLLSATFGKDPR
jgi:hypothetical protein